MCGNTLYLLKSNNSMHEGRFCRVILHVRMYFAADVKMFTFVASHTLARLAYPGLYDIRTRNLHSVVRSYLVIYVILTAKPVSFRANR